MKGKWLAACILLLIHVPAKAERCRIERQASLPITFDGFLPTVPASINGNVVRIGIDTGSSATLLTPETAERFHLPRDPRHTTITKGVGGVSQASNVFLDTLGFGGAAELMKTVAVIPIGGAKKDAMMAGLIGSDLLSDYDVEFRFPARRLILYRTSHCQKISPPWEGRYMAVPVVITDKKHFLVPVELNGHPFTAIFDTGASGMRVSRSAAERLGITGAKLAKDLQTDGVGVGQMTFKSPTHQFDQLKIGNEVFHGPHIGIIDSPLGDAEMLIGEDYMRTRRFWLSYSTKTLFIQPLRASVGGQVNTRVKVDK